MHDGIEVLGTKKISDRFRALAPTLSFKNARVAIDFYKRVFGATEKAVMPGLNGKGVKRAEIQIGDSMMMLGDEAPGRRGSRAEPARDTAIALVLYVSDVDASFRQAVAAGATVDKPVADMSWGNRAGSVRDPFGYTWWILTRDGETSMRQMANAG